MTAKALGILLVVAVLIACASKSESLPAGMSDASTAAPDGALGAGARPGELGGACCVADNCGNDVVSCNYPNGACHEDSWGTPEGMCTVWCIGPNDPSCPEGSTCGCTPGGNGQCACILACESDADCRTADGYRCCPDEGCMPTGWACGG